MDEKKFAVHESGLKLHELKCFWYVIERSRFSLIFSSPEPKAPGELIGWEGSVVRRPSVHNFKRLLL